MVLDGTTVITGNFNLTTAADTRNAENVVLIRSAEVASWYDRNWMSRQRAWRRFEVECPVRGGLEQSAAPRTLVRAARISGAAAS